MKNRVEIIREINERLERAEYGTLLFLAGYMREAERLRARRDEKKERDKMGTKAQ